MTPYKEFISGRAKPFPAPTGHFIKVDGRFIKATTSQAEQLRARRPLAKPKRARPPQSSAAKLWAQASAAATFTRQTLLRLNSLQRQRSASASD